MATPARAAADTELLRPPQQNRSRESLDRVLQAGQELLEEKGWEGFTVQEVSKRAKVSVGSIYARASSKESLILAVYDYAVSELREERESFEDPAIWEGLDLAQTVLKAMRDMVTTILRHEPILRVIMVRAATDPVIRDRGAAQILQVATQFQNVVLNRREEIVRPNAEQAVEVAFRMAYATIVRRVTLGPNFGALVDIDDETLADEMAAVMTAYLTTAPPAKPRGRKKR